MHIEMVNGNFASLQMSLLDKFQRRSEERSLPDFTDLGTENRIAVARKDYNDAVSSLNKKIRSFPMNIIANMYGVDSRYYFEASDNASEVPNVSELFNQ